jgi:hypothetical protein
MTEMTLSDPSPSRQTGGQYNLKGIANGLKIEGVGHIVYIVRNSTGMLRSIKTPGIYCPNTTVRLLSTAALLNKYDNETIALGANDLVLLSGNSDSK